MVNDSDLFLRFRDGDEAAFRQLFDAHYRSIIYFAGNILKADPYTEDIVSDSFRKAWEGRAKFTGERHLLRFLFVVTRNECINHLKAREVKRIGDREWTWLLTGADDALPLDIERAQTKLITKLYELLDNSPSPIREVLRMSFFEHKTAKEIAAEMRLTEENVYSIKSRTYKKFRAILSKELWALFVLLYGGL